MHFLGAQNALIWQHIVNLHSLKLLWGNIAFYQCIVCFVAHFLATQLLLHQFDCVSSTWKSASTNTNSTCTYLTIFHELTCCSHKNKTAKHPLAVQQKYAFWAIENHHHTTTISKKGESCSTIKCQNCTQIFSTGKTLLRPIDCVLQLAANPVAKTCKVTKINLRLYDKSKVKIILWLNGLCSTFDCQIKFSPALIGMKFCISYLSSLKSKSKQGLGPFQYYQ